MNALTVDDERPILHALTAAVTASPDISDVTEFSSCQEALEWAKENTIDIAFLDISMRGMGGMVLAERILELQPDCKIVFCTGYSEYAVDAFKIHVSGYLMKPITADAVQKEIDYIKGEKAKQRLLTVKCFGEFEVYHKREPLSFKRTKTKELLAYLIDRKGAGVSSKQICACLWEEEESDSAGNRNYFYQLMNDLVHALSQVEAECILVKKNGYYSVDTGRIDCDYYSYLEKGKPEFYGEYMNQYSWAEATCGRLWDSQA